jgi:hypothetical protein
LFGGSPHRPAILLLGLTILQFPGVLLLIFEKMFFVCSPNVRIQEWMLGLFLNSWRHVV